MIFATVNAFPSLAGLAARFVGDVHRSLRALRPQRASLALASCSLALALAAGPARAACEERVSFEDFDAALTASEAAYAENRVDLIEGTMAVSYKALECLDLLVTPPRAARFHGVVAMEQWSKARFSLARLSLMAARAADSTYALPEVLAPEDPLREAFTVTRTVSPSRERFPAPASGSFRFDGVEALDRPAELPTVVQRLDSLGNPKTGAYVWPGTDLPAYILLKKTKKQRFK